MLFPTLRDDDFDLFDDVFSVPMFGHEPLMRTDVHEKDGKYIMEMDLPGFHKEDVRISLKDGNLTVEAEHKNSDDQKDDKGNVIRQERFYGNCSRTFYVGKAVRDTDVHASFKDGTLRVEVPSAEKQVEDNQKFISIE
jgi:HSP20 family protein